MSDIMKIVIALQKKLEANTISCESLETVKCILEGIPSCYHADAFRAFLGVTEDA